MNPIFLPASDEADTALREELFTAQVTGLRQYPKAPQSLQPETLMMCEASTVTEVVQRLKVIHLLGDWPVPARLSAQVSGTFFPLTVMIFDAQDRKVLGGRFDEEIIWAQPVTLTSERLSLEQQQQRLCQAAMLEQSWQNTPAARALWHKAHLLSLHMVSSRYQQCHEVQDILRYGVSVSVFSEGTL
ncbi:hypothetical protein HZS38_01510 [Xenorhabdus nematophila]|uniref:hypothetical protein n=2 Tax=Xenorhabdus nematophila TaxID=628 RepID=UPI000542A524|nr:hypothetical protein [Xenorhabdus nematophila]CEF30650.1 hypothetical protein XNW1_2790003 [Xenorhabdus nematophila str. Websteri]AYA39375.1 hypothetical protein D3790_01780 [Xenorhabdus nematophila]MBA0017945.1 hypothetical protein [Xenorhabdus nematophila]MCB4426982.1 hypothetical protein [Xenorhabdus nematophila]QNJ37021.1 hypothetical protein H8F46_01750 [Xenorhabdus nematophila]